MFYDRKDDIAFIRWAKEVKKRDHYTCQICGRRGVELHSHHKWAWNKYPEERYDIDCGITLCRYHHDDFHVKFGKGDNTPAQFEEYKEICELLMSVAEKDIRTNNIVKNIIKQCRDDGYVDGYTA
jgi:hypothetical protein